MGCLNDGLRVIGKVGSSILFLSLLSENEFPRVDLKLAIPPSW